MSLLFFSLMVGLFQPRGSYGFTDTDHSEDLKVKIQSFSCLLFKKHSRTNIFIFTCGTEIISHTAIFLPTKCRYEQ